MRMRIVIAGLLAVLATGAALVYFGNGGRNEGASSGPIGPGARVVAAFYPLAFAAEQINPGADVENLTPPGAEPHDLEVTPRDVRDVQAAGLVLLMGSGFQPQLESAAGEGANVLRLLDAPGLDLRPGDPHVWLDPSRFQGLVEVIGQRLGRPDAAQALSDRLAALDAEFKAGLARCKRHEIITSHDAFGYLADRYGLNQVAIGGISPDAEPTPGDLQKAADAVRHSRATTVFTETLVSPKLAETVARETGAQTAVLNAIEGLSAGQQSKGEDYFGLMRENLAALRKALDCP